MFMIIIDVFVLPAFDHVYDIYIYVKLVGGFNHLEKY